MSAGGFGRDYPDVDVVPPWDEGDLATDDFKRVWNPVDLSAVLEGTWRAPQPTVGSRADGIGLLYPGKVHTVSSETEAGKTWFALAAVTDELTAGHHVAYLDFEDDEGGIVGRLLAMQNNPDVVRSRFHYLRPTEPLGTGVHLDDLRSTILDSPVTLAVIDGITEAMTLHGLDPIANKDVAAFGRILPRRIANLGPAVACLDHVTKSTEGRGRYALGAVHKLNGLDGAAFILESRTPFGIGLIGKSTVKIAKDRPGQLRRHGLPSSGGMVWFGDLVLTSHDEAFAEVSVEPPSERSEDFRPTVLMGRVADALTKHGPLAQRRLDMAVTGKAVSIRNALDCLILDGYVSEHSAQAAEALPARR